MRSGIFTGTEHKILLQVQRILDNKGASNFKTSAFQTLNQKQVNADGKLNAVI